MIKKERLELTRATRKGFTLIEILIVVAIIAILASVVLVGLGPTQQAGRDSRRLSDLHEVQNGLELYYNACGYYPGKDATTPCTGYQNVGSYTALKGILTGFASLGIGQVPDDPTAGHHYTYSVIPTTGSAYILGAVLENKNNSVFTSYTPPTNLSSYSDGSGAQACTAATGQYCLTI